MWEKKAPPDRVGVHQAAILILNCTHGAVPL